MKIKVRSHKSRKRIRINDGKRSKRLSADLLRASEKKRRKELAERGKKRVEKTVRVNIIKPPNEPDSKTTVRITMPLNKSGNLRGMHNAENTEGMQKIRAMRKLYNKQMPVPKCDACAYSQQCPKFKAGFECAFLPMLGSHGVETPTDLLCYMKDLVGANFRRAQMATALETLSGQTPSTELSESLMMLFNMTKELAEFMREEEDRSSGSLSVESNDKSIVTKLFGSMDNLLNTTQSAIENPLEASGLGGEDEEHEKKLGDGFDDLDENVATEILGEVDKTELAKMEYKKKKKISSGTQILQSVLKAR